MGTVGAQINPRLFGTERNGIEAIPSMNVLPTPTPVTM
jgi:hypothetical protein